MPAELPATGAVPTPPCPWYHPRMTPSPARKPTIGFATDLDAECTITQAGRNAINARHLGMVSYMPIATLISYS
ncbi:hypothetical protein ACS0TY_021843 [Phlomoides rotata]